MGPGSKPRGKSPPTDCAGKEKVRRLRPRLGAHHTGTACRAPEAVLLKKALLAAVALGLGVPPAQSAQADEGGWQKVRWNMTRLQVQAAYPEATNWSEDNVVTGKPFQTFGIRHYEVGRCDASVSFVFDANRLREVIITAGDDLVANSAVCSRSLVDGLVTRYGAPASDKRVSGGQVMVWHGPLTQIDALVIYIPLTNGNFSPCAIAAIKYQASAAPGL